MKIENLQCMLPNCTVKVIFRDSKTTIPDSIEEIYILRQIFLSGSVDLTL